MQSDSLAGALSRIPTLRTKHLNMGQLVGLLEHIYRFIKLIRQSTPETRQMQL